MMVSWEGKTASNTEMFSRPSLDAHHIIFTAATDQQLIIKREPHVFLVLFSVSLPLHFKFQKNKKNLKS